MRGQSQDFRLAFRRFARKIARLYASARNNNANYLFKLWPWLEANLKRIAYVAAFVVIAIFVFSFYSYRQNQKEIAAGRR